MASAAAASAEGEEASAEQPAKLIKTEDGGAVPVSSTPAPAEQAPAAMNGPASTSQGPSAAARQQVQALQQQHLPASVPQRTGSHGSGTAIDDFVLTPEMEHVLVNFLVRMAFLIGESQDKDADMQVRQQAEAAQGKHSLHTTQSCTHCSARQPGVLSW